MAQPDSPHGGQHQDIGGSNPAGDSGPPRLSPAPQPPSSGDQPGTGGPEQPWKRKARPWVLGGCAVVLVIAIIVGVLMIWDLYKVGKALENRDSASAAPTVELTTERPVPGDLELVVGTDIGPATQVDVVTASDGRLHAAVLS
jgi:hypothetical protein